MPWAPDYLTLAEGKAALRITDTVDDAELPTWITAASRAADDHCNRQFGKISVAAARVYRRPPVWDPIQGLWLLPIDDLQDSTGMTVNVGQGAVPIATLLAAGQIVLLPDNAPADGVPWESLGWPDRPTWPYYGSPQPVISVAPWGWTTTPAQVKGAVKLQLARWSKRRDAPLGIAGSPDQGSELRLLARRDPDFVSALRGLSRRRRAG